jgi:hypothetical protein
MAPVLFQLDNGFRVPDIDLPVLHALLPEGSFEHFAVQVPGLGIHDHFWHIIASPAAGTTVSGFAAAV